MAPGRGQCEDDGWLAGAAKLAALPHSASRPDLAAETVGALLDGRHRDAVLDLMAKAPSAGRITAWKALFRGIGDADIFLFFAYCPHDVISQFAQRISPMRRWSTLIEIYEACYALATSEPGDILPAYGWRVGAGHLARTRWALLSLPFTPGITRPGNLDLWRVNDSPGRLVALAQQARDDWLPVLAAIDDHPQLAGRIADIESDVAHVAITEVTRSRLGLDRLDEQARTDDLADRPGREATRFAVTRLLLPRFAWRASAVASARLANSWSRSLSCLALTAMLASLALFLAAAFIPRSSWAFTAASAAAATGYLLIAAASAAEPSAAWPWLLRQPAGAAVGVLSLAALAPDWWHVSADASARTSTAIWAAAGLAGAGLGYLYIEAAGHGIRGRRLLLRPFAVGVGGLLHSLLVTLVSLRFLLPAFAATPAGGPAMSCWYAIGSCGRHALPVLTLVALAASWSFAACVFLQIIWDDQPVTAPLAHVRWRQGG
jgi:hypothetical protein